MAQPVYPQLRKYPCIPALTLRAITGTCGHLCPKSQLASIEYVIDALSDMLIGESNGHMLIIGYVNYLLSISELDVRQIHFSEKALSDRC
jgi:hypothetical protein